jgi:DNA polymerase-3 subunit gamma/tau
MKRIAEELVRHLRNVVVAKLVPQADLDLADAEIQEVRAQADAAGAAQLTRLFDLAQRAAMEVKTSEQPRYALEIALLKACFLAPGADVGELIARLEGLGGAAPVARQSMSPQPLSGGTPGCAGEPAAQARRASSAARPAAHSTPAAAPSAHSLASRHPRPDPSEGGEGAPASTPGTPPATTADRWRALVAEVERTSSGGALLVNSLKQAVVVALTEGELTLRLPPGLPFSTVEKRKQELVERFTQFFGRPMTLSLERGSATDAGPEAPGAAGQSQSLAEIEQAEREARATRVRAAAREHPNIQEAAKILEGEVTKIEEL